MIEYRVLLPQELTRALFAAFQRRQEVTRCWRKVRDSWTLQEIAFVDDWSEADYQTLIGCLQNTLATGGLVVGAFWQGRLKGFVAVEAAPLGSAGQYLDLSSIHVSQDMRGQGVGKGLFLRAKEYARTRGAAKLYISAHSSAESQAFYRAMGCVEALEYHPGHVEAEPCDCQLECSL